MAGGVSAIPGATSIARGAGKTTGELVQKLIQEHNNSKQHKEGKRIEHLLKSFEPDNREWILFLLDGFTTIFIWLVAFDFFFRFTTTRSN